VQDALSYIGQKLSLKGVNADTVGITTSRPLDNVGEVDPQLRTTAHFNSFADNEITTRFVSPCTKYPMTNDKLETAEFPGDLRERPRGV
jgi:hypothetical protein